MDFIRARSFRKFSCRKRNKVSKKNSCKTKFGQIDIDKNAKFTAKNNDFFVSPFLQSLALKVGVNHPFKEALDILETFLGFEPFGKTTLFKICNKIAEKLPPEQVVQYPLKEKENTFAQLDGSMILTTEGWQEVKLGRIFQGHQNSTYTAYLGYHTDFEAQLDRRLNYLKADSTPLIFTIDGAVWIHHYLSKTYPKGVQILDYFHASEKLSLFAKAHFTDLKERKDWITTQSDLLLNNGVLTVVNSLKNMEVSNTAIAKQRSDLVGYYERNLSRMQYKDFREQNFCIGSGAIESANSHVIQSRMKRSGQRWTVEGAQRMLNLRVRQSSGEWNTVIKTIVS
jgi:hypothetical protein